MSVIKEMNEEEAYEKALELVNNSALALKANEAKRKRQEKLQKLYNSGNVISAVKDKETGEITVAKVESGTVDIPSKYFH